MATGSGADSGVAGGGSVFSFSLSSVFFVFFSDVASSSAFGFFFYSLLFSFALLLSSSSSSRLSRFFLVPIPCFYRQKQGGRHGGGRPLHYRSVDKKDVVKWVKCGRLIVPNPGKKLGEKRRKK